MSLISFYIMVLAQTTFDDVPAPVPNSTTAFSDYLLLFANFLMAAGALIGIMASLRIYNNWMLGIDNVWKNTVNLWLGCVMLVVTRFLIFAIF